MFDFYTSFYDNYPGIKIQGTIGKKYVYRLDHNKQIKYIYKIPDDPKTPPQILQRGIFRQAVQSWHSLSDEQKNFYRRQEPYTPTMSGFNFFVRQYIRNY